MAVGRRQRREQCERQLAAVKAVTEAVESKTDLREIIRAALAVAVETLSAQAGSILLVDADGENLVFRYVIGSQADALTGRKTPVGEGICGHVFRTGKPLITREADKDRRHLAHIDRELDFTTTTMLTAPLRTLGGATIGVVQILNKSEGQFDQADLDLLTVVAAQAATLIKTAQLQEQARLASVVRAMGDISHDIKNMLTPVITCARTLEDVFRDAFTDLDSALRPDAPADERSSTVRQAVSFLREFYPEAIEMILDGAESVQDRVRQLADCVKGHVAGPVFEVVPLSLVVGKVVAALKPVAERGRLALSVEGLDDVPAFPIDPKQIYSAVYNLVNNAIPETPAGGSISVTANCEGPDWVRLSVSDTGRGMPEHVRSRLFTDDAVSTKDGGTGLGTRIVRNVVESHGGTVSVESKEGQGTTFVLRFPTRASAPKAAPEG